MMTRTSAIYASQPKAATGAPPAKSKNKPNQPLVDFHVFADLAPELQDTIWEFLCYSAPETISIFVNDGVFKFELRGPVVVPALLHATSGARAIGLRHYTLVKFEKSVRSQRRRARQLLAQRPQLLGQPDQIEDQVAPSLHVPFFQNQGQWVAHAVQNGNLPPRPATLGHVWMNPLPAPPHLGLLGMVVPASQPQGQNPSAVVPWNPQAVAFQPGLDHHALQHLPVGEGSRQATDQLLGHQNSAQQALQYQNVSPQTSFGGNSVSGSAAQQSFLHGSHQYHSIFGGSFQSTPAGQQNGSHPNTTNQIVQAFNPHGGLAPVMGLATSSTVVLLNQARARLRILMPDDDTADHFDRCFYINTGSDYFKLHIGEPTGYSYPTYSLTKFPYTLTPVSAEIRQARLQDLQRAYTTPTSFPQTIKLPGVFARIQHLILNLELAPCLAPMRSDGFKSWLHIETANFCETRIKSTLVKFPNVKNLDLLIEGEHTCRTWAHDKMVLKHFKKAPIQEENGIEFGQAELGLLEMEIRVWIMSHYMGKHGPEGPEVRIVVHLPQHSSESRC